MYDPTLCWRAFLVVAAAALITGWVLVVKVMAHSFYDIECCSAMDCAPVDRVEIVPSQHAITSMLAPPAFASPSIMIVTTKHGTVAVPADVKHRASPDAQMHVCMRKGSDGAMRLICIYMPPSI